MLGSVLSRSAYVRKHHVSDDVVCDCRSQLYGHIERPWYVQPDLCPPKSTFTMSCIVFRLNTLELCMLAMKPQNPVPYAYSPVSRPSTSNPPSRRLPVQEAEGIGT